MGVSDSMCGVAGYFDFTDDFIRDYDKNISIAKNMGNVLSHRGPNDSGEYVGRHVAFAHTRLAVIDPVGGAQPMIKKVDGKEYTIVYNGELYNTDEIKNDLLEKGYRFETTSDTEVLLTAYIEYGVNCAEYFNGIFAFAIWDAYKKCCILCRDRFGVKPLFYTIIGSTIVFGSEIKALFEYPGISPIIDRYGLCEIFGLGPARTPGCGVFKGIHEIMPGYMAYFDPNEMRIYPYWTLKAMEHTDSYEKTVEKTRELLFDAIERQLVSDVPICTLLSGGLDSSIVSAVAAKVLKDEGRQLETYSFDYVDNHKYFKASSFQPDEDRPFVDIMVKAIGSKHHYLECDNFDLLNGLYHAVTAKDLPGMTDVDSSLLCFAKQIKENHVVSLSGECADEVFGGYPWFRDQQVYDTNAFPWSKNLDFRKQIVDPDLLKKLDLEEYVNLQYEKTIDRVPKLAGEDKLRERQREISYLNIVWFMTTLLDRKDRMTMATGLEVRVPYADHRLVEYVYNIPWEYKYHDQQVKGLLKDTARGLLPKEIIDRKKSPYPKTYNPKYEKMLKEQLAIIMKDKSSPIHELINKKTLDQLMNSASDYGKPWFGQLMAVPQMYAYLIEIDFWLKYYNIQIQL